MTARHGLGLLLVVLTAPPALGEQRCGAKHRPWVSVAFSPAVPRAFAARVLLDFRAGLGAEEIDVCADSAGPPQAPLASVRVSSRHAENIAVSVDVRDRVTSKRVVRDLDLSSVPGDGRAFATAVAAEELVRASWAELALARSPQGEEAPPEVSAAVARVLPGPRARIGARAAAERFSGGQTHFGGDAYLRRGFDLPLRLELSLGLREALAESAPHGRVRATALGAGAGLDFLAHQARGAEISLGIGVRASWVRFEGDATSGGVAREWSGIGFQSRASAGVSLRLIGPLWADLGAGAGAPLRAVEVEDDERVVTGTTGLELAFNAGLAVEL